MELMFFAMYLRVKTIYFFPDLWLNKEARSAVPALRKGGKIHEEAV